MSGMNFLRDVDVIYRPFILASILGILITLIGRIASVIVRPYFKIDLPEICKSWNKKNVMEWSLFTTGFLTYLVLEYTGILSDFSRFHSRG